MADKKMTRREALVMAIEKFNPEVEREASAIEVINKMIASIDKQADKPKTKSPARIQNEKKAIEIAEILEKRNTPVNATWITDNVKGVMTIPKANAIMAVAIELGLAYRITLGKKPYYVHKNWNPDKED